VSNVQVFTLHIEGCSNKRLDPRRKLDRHLLPLMCGE
jgi:hypothetical protein